MRTNTPLERRVKEILSTGAILFVINTLAGYAGMTTARLLFEMDKGITISRSSVEIFEKSNPVYKALSLGTYLSNKQYLAEVDR